MEQPSPWPFVAALLPSLMAGCAAAATGVAPPPRSVQEAPPAQPAGHDAADLAKKLSNPVAAMISVPFQLNHDEDIGPGEEGSRWQLNVQPVVPIELNEDWNVISRTIVPLVSLEDVPPGNDEGGLGDITQSFFFSPRAPTETGLIWGAGPALLLPTATEDELGTEKWGLGPTAVVLKQHGPWTYGGLANHIWSVAGDDDRAEVSSTFLQPFLSHTTPGAWTFTGNLEATYAWRGDEWAVPANLLVSKLLKLGGAPVSVGGGLRYWLEEAEGGPEGLGFRFVVTLLFPK